MKQLKIYNRDKTLIKIITDFNYNKLSEDKINELNIFENPKQFENKIVEVWDYNKPILSGIIKRYSWDNNNGVGSIKIYPLLVDLKDDFIRDGSGNEIFYISGQIEEVLEVILDQYLASAAIPIKIVSKGTFAVTGRNIRPTFSYVSLYEALEFLQKDMLRKGFYIKVGIDGRVDLLNSTNTVDLKNKVDIKNISFEERIDEVVKTVIFDNKSINNQILKTYTNPNPLVTSGAVKYIKDARVKHVNSADTKVEKFFTDNGSPQIEVNSILSEVDVPLYSKVNVFNWEKNFGEIYVVGKDYIPKGDKMNYNLKLGTDPVYSDSTKSSIDSLGEEIAVATDEIEPLPAYIEETKITSVLIESPTIAGNTGLFSDIFKVGVDGIVINGVEKSIKSNNFVLGSAGWKIRNDGSAEFNNITIRSDLKSSNYNLASKIGWGFLENGDFLLGKDANNYFSYNGLNFEFSGKIIAKAGSSIEWADVDNAPVSDWDNPDYITASKITQTTIESPNITTNLGKITGILKVGENGIVIDGTTNQKIIKSSNYSVGSTGWIIKNDGSAEFQNGTFRGTIKATSGELTGGFRVKDPGFIEVYEDSNNRILMGMLGGIPAIQFLDEGVLTGEIKGEYHKSITISGQSLLLNCISFSKDVYIGRDLAIQDDLVVNDSIYSGGTVFCQGKLKLPVGTNLY